MTAAVRVPISLRFPQSHRRLARKGRPVTPAGFRPQTHLRARDRGGRADDRDRLRGRMPGPPLCASSRTCRADAGGTSCCKSSASTTRTAPVCTNRGTRNSGDAKSSWAPSTDGRRRRALPRILRHRRRYAAAIRPREWISRPPQSGSPRTVPRSDGKYYLGLPHLSRRENTEGGGHFSIPLPVLAAMCLSSFAIMSPIFSSVCL